MTPEEKAAARAARKLENYRRWAQKNREYVNEKAKAWYYANREEVLNRRKSPEQAARRREAERKRYATSERRRESRRHGARVWHKKHPAHDVLRICGLKGHHYQEMLAAQQHRCAICESPLQPKHTCLDHCHAAHRVRAILCRTCNCLLGFAKDKPDVLRAAADYLERHHARLKQTARPSAA